LLGAVALPAIGDTSVVQPCVPFAAASLGQLAGAALDAPASGGAVGTPAVVARGPKSQVSSVAPPGPAPTSGGSAGSGAASAAGGGGSPSFFVTLAIALVAIALLLFERLRLPALIWRPVAFVSLHERPG
jgi:hypothetical protein